MYIARLHMRGSAELGMRYLCEWLNTPPPPVSIQRHENCWITLYLGDYALEYLDTQEWLALGQHIGLFFESCNSSLCAGELVLILGGEVRRHVVTDSGNPESEVNIGRLRYEERSPINGWADIWTFVEDSHWQNEVS
jgi:hypothetical protein